MVAISSLGVEITSQRNERQKIYFCDFLCDLVFDIGQQVH